MWVDANAFPLAAQFGLALEGKFFSHHNWAEHLRASDTVLMLFCLFFQNIRIMAKYYTRITMKRMAGLLDLSVDVSGTFTWKTLISNAQKNTKVW